MYKIIEKKKSPDWIYPNSPFGKLAKSQFSEIFNPITYLPKNISGFKITWNHRPDHNIYDKIKERSTIAYQPDFNDQVIKVVDKIKENINVIPISVFKKGKLIENVICVNLFLKDCAFLICYYKHENRIHIKTIVTRKTSETEKCETILDIV